MADFCKQCSIVIFGRDFEELSFKSEGALNFEKALCEGCGWTVVNSKGECVNRNHNHPTKDPNTILKELL